MASTSGSRSGAGKKNTSSSSRTRNSSYKKKSTAKGTGSRSTAARGQRKEESALTSEIILIGVFALSVLLFLCNFGIIGPVGDVVSSFMFGLFGMIAYVVPVLIFVGLAFGISNSGNFFATVKIAAGVLLLLLVGVVLELIGGQVPSMESYSIISLYQVSAESKTGGGILSGSLAYLLDHFLGMVGAVVLVLVLVIICLVLITEKSFVSGVRSGGRRVYESAREDARIRKERAMKRREELEARREEELRRQEEEDAQEKVLRMDRKVSGVMINNVLEQEENLPNTASGMVTEGSLAGTNPFVGASFAEMREITVDTPLETVVEEVQAVPQNDNIIDFDKIQIHTAYSEKEKETAALKAAFARRRVPQDPLAKAYSDSDVYSDMKAVTPMHITVKPLAEEAAFSRFHQEVLPGAFLAGEAVALAESEEGVVSASAMPEEEVTVEHTGESEADSLPWDRGLREAGIQEESLQEESLSEDSLAEENSRAENSYDENQPDISETETPAIRERVRPKAVLPSDRHETSSHRTMTPRPSEQVTVPTTVKMAGQTAMEEMKAAGAAAVTKPKPPQRPYQLPPLALLKNIANRDGKDAVKELKNTAAKLQQTLATFGVKVTITDISQGPAVTRYELQPEQGVKVSKIVGLTDDIKLNLAATDIRIEAPIPGKAAVGIEVPNKENSMVGLRELLESKEFKDFPSKLSFAVGKDIAGKTVVTDIAKMPHMLIAGSTGSGKSVCINTLIMSILYKAKPDEVKLILIDPKVVELSVYNGIPHLLIPVVTDPKQASSALHWGVAEMTDRYQKFADMNVRDLKGYNRKLEEMRSKGIENVPDKLPQIVIIVDELADLMMVAPGEVEESICRLAQLARAAGIHLIIATQRPSVDVITGLIKANMPSRVAFAVSSGVDSRTILDMNGAEKLLGKGDMLFYPQGYPKPARVQGAFVSDGEVSDVVDYLKNQVIGNVYDDQILDKVKTISTGSSSGGDMGEDSQRDSYFEQAARFIIEKDKASSGMLQRAFKIGFNRAARIMDQLAEAGVVGEEEGTKPRKILMSEEQLEQYIEDYL